MSDAHGGHAGNHVHPNYLLVFVGLLILTSISFFCSEAIGSKTTTVLLVMGLSSLKVLLVAMFFMHVKFEGVWLYVILVPTCVIATVLLCVLLPDIAKVGFQSVISGG
ncbi:MAG: cytochrome C oxidase subunit IV family protein [Planctomycetes bacterium]|nr:cytochrome C oxidase subunit IV family protein [Planctomycetota bacterium]